MDVEQFSPQWVLTFPEQLSDSARESVRRYLTEALASGKPVLLESGAMLYDARNSGAPLPVVTAAELEATSTVDTPGWVLLLMALAVSALCVSAGALVAIADRLPA